MDLIQDFYPCLDRQVRPLLLLRRQLFKSSLDLRARSFRRLDYTFQKFALYRIANCFSFQGEWNNSNPRAALQSAAYQRK